MHLIGKGYFTKCFYDGKSSTVHLISSDPVKEVIADGWIEESRMFPKINYSKLSKFDYSMKYYPKVTSLKKTLRPRQYRLYKELRRVSNMYSESPKCFLRNLSSLPSEFYREVNNIADYYNSLVSTLGTTIMFEISPRNVAVNNGSLILLDCFFDRSKL